MTQNWLLPQKTETKLRIHNSFKKWAELTEIKIRWSVEWEIRTVAIVFLKNLLEQQAIAT